MARKVILKPKDGAAPGFPGFVAWLANVHPKLYSYADAAHPTMVARLENRLNPAAFIGGRVPGDMRAATVLGEYQGMGDLTDAQAAALNLSPTGTATPASASALQQFVSTIVTAGASILPLVQQQKVLKMQLDRANKGLPPLDVGNYIDPNAGVNVGITPATQKLLLMLGGGLLGTFLLVRVMGRR